MMLKRTVFTALALALFACEQPTTPDTRGPLFSRIGRAPKVDICHGTGNGSFHLINVSQNAEPDHRAHGDGQVGDPVPGMEGYEFDEGCVPVPSVTCPCFSAADLDAQPWKDLAQLSAVPISSGGFRILATGVVSPPRIFAEHKTGNDPRCSLIREGVENLGDLNISHGNLSQEECDECDRLLTEKAADLGLLD